MNKENFKKTINSKLNELSKSEILDLFNNLLDDLPSDYYEYLLCKIKYFKNEVCELDKEDILEYEDILEDFKKVSDGEICFRGYSYETGTYSYYDADVNYEYYPSGELQRLFDRTYELIKKLILYKEYSKIVILFEAIIYTDYTCEEVGNPEYDDTNEVYDSYEVSFDNVKNDLGIDLNKLCLYAIYSLIISNKSDRLEKILKYTKICRHVDIRDVENIGIDKISNFEKFYLEWQEYLKVRS